MTRRRITLLLLPILLILLLAGGFVWLLRSESGAQWLWQQLAAAAPGQLQAQRSRGDLRSGLTLEGFSYRDAGLVLTADTITLRLGLDLWPPAVAVEHLRIGELSVQTQPAPPDAAAGSAGEWLPALALPVRVTFRRVEGARVTWSGGADERRIDLRDLSLSGEWYRRLVLREARLENGGSRWQADFDLPCNPRTAWSSRLQAASLWPRRRPGWRNFRSGRRPRATSGSRSGLSKPTIRSSGSAANCATCPPGRTGTCGSRPSASIGHRLLRNRRCPCTVW